jgi:two-component system, chemotaxis family, sensor kinase CheA
MAGTNEIDPEILQLAREEAEERVENIERNLLALEAGSLGPDAIDELFRDAHSIKSAASMLGWKPASSVAHAMEDLFDECREGRGSLVELTDPLLRALDALKGAVAGREIEVSAVVSELSSATNGAPAAASEDASVPEAEEAVTGPNANGTTEVAAQSIRVAAPKVDRMLDAVGESVLHQRRLEHLLSDRITAEGDDEAEEEMSQGDRLLSELHDSVIGMRTLPLSSITAPFPRAVRDVAVAEGKEVTLKIEGAETQLDRVILEGLGEMINHILRNAVAHGIEPPDEREAAGKTREGTVELRAEQRGGMVAIDVSDDGRGVSAEVLRRAEAAGSLTDLLATPGFSTAENVSGVSGRGVGLDAVKEHVEGLGGNLEVESEPGRGMKVTMLLPLTLALLRLLMCKRGGQTYGLPLTSVREVVTVADTVSLGGRRSLEIRGETVPLEDIADLLGASAPALSDQPSAMVITTGGRRTAVACDEVIGDQEVVAKGLGPLLSETQGYLGAAILGDGQIALIVDPNDILRRPAVQDRPARAAASREAPTEAPKVLITDDQFTVRELQRSILETAGYRVETANNGVEALERIGLGGVDIVLTDVEMPEMDGFELLRAIREDPESGSLPVVMVTSMGGEEQRRRGAEEGADAYIVKEDYDQQALLDVIARLIGG